MNKKERDSLTECLMIIYSITREMQEVCQGLEDRLPPADAPTHIKETVLHGFSIIFEASAERLVSAGLTIGAHLQNTRVPQAPTSH